MLPTTDGTKLIETLSYIELFWIGVYLYMYYVYFVFELMDINFITLFRILF